MDRRGVRLFALLLVGLAALCLLFGAWLWQRYGAVFSTPPLPSFPSLLPYTPWPTPALADAFDWPLQPADGYAPYVQGETGPLAVDTRYGTQNPSMGDRANCFRDAAGEPVPFSQLYHAGVDLFAVDGAGQVAWGQAAHAPVYAVGDGVVVHRQDVGEGEVLIVRHRLADESDVYSVYWHVDAVQVERGQPVRRGQIIAVVRNQGLNSHLHWEMRRFGDGSALFPAGTAGERGTCNGRFAGVAYTWEDDPARASPDFYGYLDPIAFVEARRTGP